MSIEKLIVINTSKGLFHYTHLPYGISSAPEIFQRLMDNLVQGLEGVIVYIDNILFFMEEKHLQRLECLLSHLEKAGLHARHAKCSFMVTSVTFLGHCR